jgi:hypothetical protein
VIGCVLFAASTLVAGATVGLLVAALAAMADRNDRDG